MVIQKSTGVDVPVTIELMRLEDVNQVAALDEQCFPVPWSVSAYMTEIHNRAGYYIVAKMDGQVVGYAGEWLIMDEAHITTIGVDPQLRGKKIGERLLSGLLDEAIRRGIKRATLEVRRSNIVAQGLYRKYGFQMMAIRKGYYTDNMEDAFVMWTGDMQEASYLRVFNANKAKLGESA